MTEEEFFRAVSPSGSISGSSRIERQESRSSNHHIVNSVPAKGMVKINVKVTIPSEKVIVPVPREEVPAHAVNCPRLHALVGADGARQLGMGVTGTAVDKSIADKPNKLPLAQHIACRQEQAGTSLEEKSHKKHNQGHGIAAETLHELSSKHYQGCAGEAEIAVSPLTIEKSWDHHFHRLCEYKTKHKTAEVPEDQYNLYMWLQEQKEQYHQKQMGSLPEGSELTLGRFQKLKSLGVFDDKDQFVELSLNDKRWTQMFQRLIKYKEEKGDFEGYGYKYHRDDPKYLSQWVFEQRCECSNLLHRKNLLNQKDPFTNERKRKLDR